MVAGGTAVVVVVVASTLQNMFRVKNSMIRLLFGRRTEDIGSSSNTLPLHYCCTDIAVVPHTREKTCGTGIRLRFVSAVSSTSSMTYSYSSTTRQQQTASLLLCVQYWFWSLESYSCGKKQTCYCSRSGCCAPDGVLGSRLR